MDPSQTNTGFNAIMFVILLPMIGFLIQAFFGHEVQRIFGQKTGRQIMGAIATLVVAAAFLVTIPMVMTLASFGGSTRQIVVPIGNWITTGTVKMPFELMVDPLSLTMVLVITGIGSLIHLYATGYMAEDRDYTRFFTYMNLFITAMLILVLADNLVLMFVGWEGVGLCSYLLIGFWYADKQNAKAANKAFITNRIGDWGFMTGMFLLASSILAAGIDQRITGGRLFSFDVINTALPQYLSHHPALAFWTCLALFVGCAGKSAQFPLYVWLPDAMAGPTPVSALIHAATMVTSGIYVMCRLSPIFATSKEAGAVIVLVGAFTALFAAVIAFGQTDIKKVLAYSTVSQLGFMFVATGSGGYTAGMFHVITHAFFKALLFLGAGAVIHAMAHNQDLRNYGKLSKYLPVTCWTMFIGFLAISGFPFLSGFYSKGEILKWAFGGAQAWTGGVDYSAIAGVGALIAAILTGAYMARLTWLTFFGDKERWRDLPVQAGEVHTEPKRPYISSIRLPDIDPHGFYYTDAEVAAHDEQFGEEEHSHLGPDHVPHEVPVSMAFPLIVLAVGALSAGFLLDGRLDQWLSTSVAPVYQAQTLPWVEPASIAAALLGMAIGIALYLKGLPGNEGWDLAKWQGWRKLAGNQFGYDQAVTEGGSSVGRGIAYFASGFDSVVVEGILAIIAIVANGFGDLLRKLQTGYVRLYAAVMLGGAVAWIGYVVLMSGRGGH